MRRLVILAIFATFVLSVLALVHRLRRSEQKRRAAWIATHPPLADAAFTELAGASNQQTASVALRVRRIIADWAGVPPAHVYPDTTLADLSRLEWDGANSAELEISLEKAFDLKTGELPPETKT